MRVILILVKSMILAFNEAVSSSDSNNCLTTMQEYLKFMQDSNVWDLFYLSDSVKPIGCNGYIRLKGIPNGIIMLQASMVAKDFTQREGIDFKETVLPVLINA